MHEEGSVKWDGILACSVMGPVEENSAMEMRNGEQFQGSLCLLHYSGLCFSL